MKITILLPTLNEEAGIGPTLDSVPVAALERAGHTVDFLVIDGQSVDATRAEAEKRGARVVIEPRRGYGRAYKRGFTEATGDVIITGDADGTYPFERIPEYLDVLMREDLDFVTCNRYAELEPGAMSRKHRFGNWVLSLNTRLLFRVGVHDSQTGMWLIRRRFLHKVPWERLSEGMAFSQEIKIEAFRNPDVAALEVDGALRPRVGPAVIESWRDGLGNLRALWAKRLRRS